MLSMLADAANATDPLLRAKARKLAAKLFITLASSGTPTKRGIKRMTRVNDALAGDLDLDATLARTGGTLPLASDEFVTRRWAASERSICLLIDRSGSMSGHGVAMASLGAASVVVAAGERAECSVIMFAKDSIVLQEMGQKRRLEDLIGDVLSLRGRGVTDLALALRCARRQLGKASARERVAILLSDAIATEGADPVTALRGVDRLHVLGTSDEAESVEAGRLLARRGGGSYRTCTSVVDLPAALSALLAVGDPGR
jgi:von Willebrand factor type A domain